MEKPIKFTSKSINLIQDIIKSPSAVGRYRGEEVFQVLERTINELDNYTLLIIDIREANPLQYVFCQYAFGPLLKILQENGSEKRRFIFQMHEHHKTCFFRGVLKNIDKTILRNESFPAFIESDLFTLLKIGNQTQIEFVSRLSELDRVLLNLINETGTISVRKIIESIKNYEPDSIVDSLRSLNFKGFIIHIKNELDQYYSLYQYLN
jgi:hypothetical protein